MPHSTMLRRRNTVRTLAYSMPTGTWIASRRVMQRHHFTVDVEEYFQVSAFEGAVDRASWDGIASRVQLPMFLLLDLLARHNARATFFFLGWVAERHPHLVKLVAREGHEIASHGWGTSV